MTLSHYKSNILIPGSKSVFHDKLITDASEQAAIQDWVPLEITQISSGPYDGNIKIFQHHDVSAVFESQNRTIHKRGIMYKDLCTVSFITSQSENIQQLRFSSYKSAENSLFFLPSGTEFDVHVKENSNTIYFLLDQPSILEKFRALDPTRWDKDPEDLLLFDTSERHSIDFMAEQIFSPMTSGNSPTKNARIHISSSIISDLLVTVISTSNITSEDKKSDSISLKRSRAIVIGFIDFVLSEFQKHLCPSIVDICLELKVSQRTMQYSFQKTLGITPIAYLRCLRLNKVRRQLSNSIDPNETVTQIAMHWHFLHLGKFSYDYNRMFGELPSKTLTRARKMYSCSNVGKAEK